MKSAPVALYFGPAATPEDRAKTRAWAAKQRPGASLLEFEDSTPSPGGPWQRPGFKTLLDAIEHRGVREIFTSELDDQGPELEAALAALKVLAGRRAKVLSPRRRAWNPLQTALAAFNALRTRVVRHGGGAPKGNQFRLGWRKEYDTKRLKLIHSLVRKGKTLREIADEVSRVEGRKKPIAHTTIQRILERHPPPKA